RYACSVAMSAALPLWAAIGSSIEIDACTSPSKSARSAARSELFSASEDAGDSGDFFVSFDAGGMFAGGGDGGGAKAGARDGAAATEGVESRRASTAAGRAGSGSGPRATAGD